tara:strand:+ start:90 stop:383 length:294 start_codon:yes stop_codon:yes gene_type:complete
MEFNNTFANSTGDYLAIRKGAHIYDVDNTKTKINNNKIVKRKQNNFENQMLFSKGVRLHEKDDRTTKCTIPNTFPYKRVVPVGIDAASEDAYAREAF